MRLNGTMTEAFNSQAVFVPRMNPQVPCFQKDMRVDKMSKTSFYMNIVANKRMLYKPPYAKSYNVPVLGYFQSSNNSFINVMNNSSVPLYTGKTDTNALKRSPCKHSPQKVKELTGRYYAGAKFCDHPDPSQLPKPPERWINGHYNSERDVLSEKERCLAMSVQLKLLLKVEENF